MAATATVIPLDDIRRSPRAALFEGGDDVAISMFVTRYELDEGPDLHTHPYAEVFYVQEGTATFTVGDGEVVAGEGHIVVVPPETVHGFKNRTGGVLRVVSAHPNGRVLQTDL